LHSGGMTIGGHTVNHPVLARHDRRRQMSEVSTCLQRIHTEIGILPECFSYPVGAEDAINDVTLGCLRDSQVKFAFSYYGGFNPSGNIDPLNIRRTSVEVDTTLSVFRMQMAVPQLLA